jgi:hypothetical protein
VLQFEASVAKGFDGAGKEIAAADLVKRLEKETPVIVLETGRKPDAALSATLKKETLVLSLPVSFASVHARGAGPSVPVPVPVPAPTPAPPK